jgi:hypothetical protein
MAASFAMFRVIATSMTISQNDTSGPLRAIQIFEQPAIPPVALIREGLLTLNLARFAIAFVRGERSQPLYLPKAYNL